MQRKLNFNAGPSALPESVLDQAKSELLGSEENGSSLLEESHRGERYAQIHNSTLELLLKTLGLSDTDYHVLFLGGGATLQFAMLPLNFSGEDSKAAYLCTGAWSKKAFADARKTGNAFCAWDGSESAYSRVPGPGEIKITPNTAYLHLTSNETIHGVQWHTWPDTKGVPLIADMSSDIISRALPCDKFDMIYAGAQKNMGVAGLTVIIAKKSLIEKSAQDLPAYLSYATHSKSNSLYNTPPVFGVYFLNKILQWVCENGGVSEMNKLCEQKSGAIYSVIDEYPDFYFSPVEKPSRSLTNVVFRLKNSDLEPVFLEKAKEKGMIGLKGHRDLGGMRASLYNAVKTEDTEALADFMRSFLKR